MGKRVTTSGFFHWFASWNEILVTVFPVRCVCTTIQTYSCLFAWYWILTNLNDVSSASTCAKYTYFSFLEFLLGYALLFSLNLQTAQRTQVHVKSWYVFTEAKRLSGEKKKKRELKGCFQNRKISWVTVILVPNPECNDLPAWSRNIFISS